MISVSSAYKAAANSNARQINARIVIGAVEYDNDDIISIDISGGSGSGGMSIGATIATRMVTVIKCITPSTMTGYQIDVYAEINASGYQQLGRYYITNVTRDNGYTTIEAYDKMYWLDKPCNFNGTKSGTVAALTWPATHQQMIDYIAAIKGFTADVTCAAFAPVPSRPIYNSEATSVEGKYYTYREIISFIAASNGCNAQFNNIGSLVFTRPGTAVETITDTDCESCSIDPSDDGFTVVGIRMVTGAGIDFYIDADESDYDEDTAGVLSCDNPLATVEIAEYVWSKLGGFKYYAAQVTRRGRGWLMPDDVINVKYDNVTYPALVGEISYSISADGGFNESITSTAESEAESSNRALDSAHSAAAAKNITNTVQVDKAIILTQEDAQTLVHNFVQTGYVAGQQIGYSSAIGDIIVQGYVVQHYQTATVRYQSVTLTNVYYGASSDYSDQVIHDTVTFWAFVSVSTQNYGYLSIKNDVGWGYYTSSSAVVLNNYRDSVGLNMYWTSIQPPSDDYPFGYALVNLHGVYKDQVGRMDTHGGYSNLRLPFASAAEYNAAIGLTNTPLELIKLEDYPYIVPESKLVIDNTVSKGSTNPISNAAVANALDNKADAEHTHSYDDLSDKPKINGIDVIGDRSAADLELADREHTHTADDITDMPSSLPADGGNADTLDNKHAEDFAEAEHTHAKSDITDFPASLKNPASLTVKLGGTVNQTYDGSAAKTVDITPSGIGASTSEDIKAAVEAVEIGGRNLVTGTANMTVGTGGRAKGHWRLSGTTAGTISAIDIADSPLAGIDKGLKFTAAAKSQVGVCQNNVPLNCSNLYTLSCWVRGSSDSGLICRLQPFYYSNDDRSGYGDFNITREWTHISFTSVCKPQQITKYICGAVYFLPSAADDTMEICGVKLESGNKATDWTPAPEDIKTLIDNHIHTVLFAENIASQTLDLDSLTANTTAEKGTTKRYYCPTVSTANITHRPISVNQPFLLEVENIRWASESTYITRQLYTCVSRKKQYERWCTDGTWSRWKALAPLVIYGSVTADLPKTFSYSSYGEGYGIVEIKAYYDHTTVGLSNSKAVALATDTTFERTIITYNATGTSLIFKLENGDITISAVGGSTTLGFRLTYLN